MMAKLEKDLILSHGEIEEYKWFTTKKAADMRLAEWRKEEEDER